MARRNKIKKEIRGASFFKVLMGDFSKRLRIPSAFVENFNGKSLGRCVVQSPTGECWFVNAEETEQGLYFAGGWQDFVEDHCLETGDFMVFKYCGKSEFRVKIYDKTCCEKKIYLHPRNGNGNSGNENGNENENETETETSPITLRCNREISEGGFTRPVEKTVIGEVSGIATSSSPTFKSDNSWFLLLWTSPRKYCLTIPIELVREKKLMTKKMVEIIDPAGKKWVVGLFKSKNGRCLIMKGEKWIHFWKENEIKIGDPLIFEFAKPTAMQVHIFKGMGKLGLGLKRAASNGSRIRKNYMVVNECGCQ